MAFQDSSEGVNGVITNLKFISEVIGHLIWPMTLLIIFWIFRKHFANIMKKLSGIDASSTGISLKFDQQIDEAIENNLPSNTPEIISKSGIRIGEKKVNDIPKTPFHQILSIRDELNHRIFLKSQENNIVTEHKSTIELKNELLKLEAISPQDGKLFQTLINLTNSVDNTISQSQVNKIQLLYINLKL